MVFEGKVTLLMDLKIALQYRDVARRPEHLAASHLSQMEVSELIEALEVFSEPVKVWMRTRPLSSDPNDDMVLQLAISGSADALVTHNVRHFRAAGERFGIIVSSPSEFLQLLTRGNHGN